MTEKTTGTGLAVEVTATARNELCQVTSAPENKGKAVRVLFRGFG